MPRKLLFCASAMTVGLLWSVPQVASQVFVDTPIAECIERDPKGLYAKARAGQLVLGHIRDGILQVVTHSQPELSHALQPIPGR